MKLEKIINKTREALKVGVISYISLVGFDYSMGLGHTNIFPRFGITEEQKDVIIKEDLERFNENQFLYKALRLGQYLSLKQNGG